MNKKYAFFLLSLLVLSSCDFPTASDSLPSDSPSLDSSPSSSGESSFDTTISSDGPGEPPLGEYRINPKPSEGDTGYVYDQYGEIVKELYRNEYYTDLEDVAAYIVTFKETPVNYYFSDERDGYSNAKRECYGLYGDACRIFPGPYDSNYDYLPHSLDYKYNEADIGGEGYAESSSWNRGALRVVFTIKGISDYGSDVPVVFYTGDHYDTFIEYKNYYGGWGEEFGLSGSSWESIDTWF